MSTSKASVAKATQDEILRSIAEAMKISRKAAISRLVALGYTIVCSRCGGSGRYSFNPTDGDRCFGCSGHGKMLQALTPAVITEAVARVAAGELAGYFATNRARSAIRAKAEAARETYRASPISVAYEERYRATRNGDPRACLDSPAGRAQLLQNAVIARVERVRYDRSNEHDPIKACRQIDEAHNDLRAVIAAWLACGCTATQD